MSAENVQIVRSLYDAFSQGDIDYVLGLLDPQVEWLEAEGTAFAKGNPYIGRDAVLGVFEHTGAEWASFAVSVAEILDAGSTVVTRGVLDVTHRESRREGNVQFAHFFRLRDGLVTHVQEYCDTATLRDLMGQSSATAS